MSQQNNTSTENKPKGPELIEEFLYVVTPSDNPSFKEIAQYRLGAFWFFGWGTPEPIEKFSEWKELVVCIKNE